MRTRLVYILLSLAMLLIYVCFLPSDEAEAYTVENKQVTIYEGETYPMDFFVSDADFMNLRLLSSDRSVSTPTKDGALLGLKIGDCIITISDKKGTRDEIEVKVVSKEDIHMVALTLDDGPGSHGMELMDFFDSRNVKATFFLIGADVGNYPQSVQRMVDEGHEIGNHCMNHKQLTAVKKARALEEIEDGAKAIEDVAGVPPTVFRPPYGDSTEEQRIAAGMPTVLWNIDTLDWKYKDADRVAKEIINGAKDGNIILVHEIYKTTVEGVKKAVDKLTAKGVRFVTATTLLTRDGSKVEDLIGQRLFSKRIKKK
ncbi:MAG: polysaccharide deacetylase family protein [Lachnospiraceae bacterium]|nr:polysaccharide deacetylase family protein [Lachnospiraceae bacterium]